MGQPLDHILGKIVDQDFTVNSDYTSPRIDVSYQEDQFAIQLDYDNGSTVDMTLSLEGSVDGVNYATITDTDQQIVDNSGTHIWDLDGIGLVYMRVVITVSTGSIDVGKIQYTAKRRH